MFGTKASLIIDIFLLVQVVLVPVLAWGITLARKGRIRAHARVMVVCFALFLLTVLAFEIDVHLVGSPTRPAVGPLIIHLCFALPALVLWAVQVARAKSAVTNPTTHKRRGRTVFALLIPTVATGIWLYLATFR